jgi:hypothetical protein
VRQDLRDRLVAGPGLEVLVDEPAGAGRHDPVAEVHVPQARAERQGEVESVATRDGRVREVEDRRVDVELDRVVAGGVDVGHEGACSPGEHVLDRQLHARRGGHLPDQVEEPRGVPPLPPEGRVHDDRAGSELRRELGRAPQLVALVAAEGEVRERQHRRVHRQHRQPPASHGGAEQTGVPARPVRGHHDLDAVEAGRPREAEGLVDGEGEDAGRARSDRDHAVRLRPPPRRRSRAPVNVARTTGERRRTGPRPDADRDASTA